MGHTPPTVALESLEFQLSLLNLTSAGTEVRSQVEQLQRMMKSSEQILIARK